MTTKYLDKDGLTFLWGKLKNYFQPKLVSGTNIKTVNNTSLLGSGNISITGNVTGVKGDSESSYRTGNVNLTADNVGAVAVGSPLFTTNSFVRRQNGSSSLYISKIDNAFYCADKRFNVTLTDNGTSVSASSLFDGDYESGPIIQNGNTAVLTFDFSDLSGSRFPGYPYGYIYVSFYYVTAPASITGRVYNNYSSQGTGWHDLTFERVYSETEGQNVYRTRQSYYGMQTLEITIVGDTTNSYGYTRPIQVEYWLDRPAPSRTPFVTKYASETLYYNLTAPKFIGALQGNADTATTAEKIPLNIITGETINSFRGNYFRHARVTSYPDVGLASNDGVVLWIPYSDAYGRQLLFEDNGRLIKERYYNNGTWSTWEKIAAGNADTVNGKTVAVNVPSNAVFTDTKVTAVGNHYTPSGGTTTSASGATGTSGTTVQVVTGVTKDAAGHVTGITSGAATDTTYESKSAASGGTAVSLVTTGEKYTWNNKSSLGLGETSSTAYRGDRGKTAYDHSQSTHARTDATKTEASSTNGNIKINGTETTVYTHPSGTNPHGTTKADVGLGNVGNFKAVSTVASQGLTTTEQSNARANIGAGTSSLTLGTTSTTAAKGDHTHSGYQATLVSGTNIKTINSTSLLGSGNIATLQLGTTSTTAAKGDHTHSAYENVVTGVTDNQTKLRVDYKSQGTSLYAEVPTVSGMDAKQDTLVSGTNIKTINNNSILGSGNISISGSGVTPSFSGLADNAGSVVLGDLVIEWGVVSITSGSSGGTAGGVTLYAGQTNVTYTNTFAYYPSVSLAWSGNYVNQVALATINTSNTGFTVVGRMLTANSARSVRWLAIGKKA